MWCGCSNIDLNNAAPRRCWAFKNMESLFGSSARICIADVDPPQVSGEDLLLQKLRLLVGPYASEERLLHHLRASRAKMHWAVNSYFREVLTSLKPNMHPDYIPKHAVPRPIQSVDLIQRVHDSADSQASQLFRNPTSCCADAVSANAVCTGHQCGLPSHGYILDTEHRDVCGFENVGNEQKHKAECGDCVDFSADVDSSVCWGMSRTGHSRALIVNEGEVPGIMSEACLAGGMVEEVLPMSGEGALEGSGGCMDSFPAALLEEVLMHLDAWSVCQAAATNKAFRQASASERVWEAMFKAAPWHGVFFPTEPELNPDCSKLRSSKGTRIGLSVPGLDVCKAAAPLAPKFTHSSINNSPAERSCLASSSDAIITTCTEEGESSGTQDATILQNQEKNCESLLSWKAEFKRQAELIHSMGCPRCGGVRLVPIVYGFPSTHLMQVLQRKQLIFGGDYLIEGCRVWACTACNSSFRAYPYHAPQLWIEEFAYSKQGPNHDDRPLSQGCVYYI
ncbi:hypothetical protein CEUSTIGMA_g9690.t1 [Chlamydomonas eustigma]|uniref:F-box domain-containing protein n=1 Tax=Chlamydomonas eustigma TaxID=1157962 RepID=A0A250XH66_9CHLO|nr:hypothetical protein CEUSTIGMA_g9690.t1 [Chlamydomonas eustigma]|eukprot:GAX82262.1 hypothetical protein CEUSTIGMA_g9690.t1 [Chlamydomonas eustigma]